MKQSGCWTSITAAFVHTPPASLNFHRPGKRLSCRWRSRAIHKRPTAPSHSSSHKPYPEVEQDIITFLHPPKHLIPLDPCSFNPAHYLCNKIGDIPEERRHRLLSLLNPSLVSRAWEVAGTKYDDPKLAKKSASNILHGYDGNDGLVEFWNCRSSGGPAPIAWFNYFKKAVFRCDDGRRCGRFIAKHPWPFNDQVVVYIRQIGPGVLVAQAWQEGEAVEQIPKKFCGEILMVKDYGQL